MNVGTDEVEAYLTSADAEVSWIKENLFEETPDGYGLTKGIELRISKFNKELKEMKTRWKGTSQETDGKFQHLENLALPLEPTLAQVRINFEQIAPLLRRIRQSKNAADRTHPVVAIQVCAAVQQYLGMFGRSRDKVYAAEQLWKESALLGIVPVMVENYIAVSKIRSEMADLASEAEELLATLAPSDVFTSSCLVDLQATCKLIESDYTALADTAVSMTCLFAAILQRGQSASMNSCAESFLEFCELKDSKDSAAIKEAAVRAMESAKESTFVSTNAPQVISKEVRARLEALSSQPEEVATVLDKLEQVPSAGNDHTDRTATSTEPASEIYNARRKILESLLSFLGLWQSLLGDSQPDGPFFKWLVGKLGDSSISLEDVWTTISPLEFCDLRRSLENAHAVELEGDSIIQYVDKVGQHLSDAKTRTIVNTITKPICCKQREAAIESFIAKVEGKSSVHKEACRRLESYRRDFAGMKIGNLLKCQRATLFGLINLVTSLSLDTSPTRPSIAAFAEDVSFSLQDLEFIEACIRVADARRAAQALPKSKVLGALAHSVIDELFECGVVAFDGRSKVVKSKRRADAVLNVFSNLVLVRTDKKLLFYCSRDQTRIVLDVKSSAARAGEGDGRTLRICDAISVAFKTENDFVKAKTLLS